MPFFFIYLLKVSVSLAVVFLFYHFVLQKLTFYTWNRWYLLVYTGLSFFIPFIDISPVLEGNDWTKSNIVQWVPVIGDYKENVIAAPSSALILTPVNIVWLLIVSGMLILLFRLFTRFISYRRMMKKAQFISGDTMKIFQVNENIIPFSFGNSIFINRHLHSEGELQEIIRHEFVHVKQKHSIDIIWGELLCLLSWYNPVAWLLKKSIRQNLEFIADNKVLENGINKKEYQYLLLKVTGNNQYSIATQFNFSSLKKRIAMMNKLKSAKINLFRFLFVLPLLAVILVSFRKQIGDTLTQKEKSNEAVIYTASKDTIPELKEPNNKGYYIEVKDNNGNCTLVIKDKNRKEVTRLLLTDWNKKEAYYTDLYGEIPPPPPKVPAPPVPFKLPDFVKRIDRNTEYVEVWLKDGKKESYDLTVPSQQEAFEKKYGPIPPPPPPAKAPRTENDEALNNVSNEYEITDKKAVIKLKNGTVEKYDLTNKQQRSAFEKKYGKIINVATTVNARINEDVRTNINTDVKTNVNTNINEVIKTNINTDVKTNINTTVNADVRAAIAAVPVRSSVTTTLSPVVSISRSVSAVSAPVGSLSTTSGTTVIAALSPLSATDAVTIVDDYGYTITGKEDILITITKNTTADQLEDFKKQMKEKGIELSFDEVRYDKGKLVKIAGRMHSKDNHNNFSAKDFNTLILAMIKKGQKMYFKVNVKDNKIVI